MNAARIAALLAEGHGPASARLLATRRLAVWSGLLELADSPEQREQAAARCVFWRTISTRLASHHRAPEVS